MAEAETRAADDETVDYETAYIRDLDPNPDPSANDIFPTETSNQGGYKTTIAQIGIVTNGVSGVCTETAANVKDKIVVLSNYNGKVLPREFDVTFTNGNSYGDTTAASPTFPTLYVYNKDGKDFLGSVDVGDSRGHYAGSGCWNAGDTMQFRIMNNKACITNSDVRQVTSEYTIMSDGKIEQYGSFKANKTGDVYLVLPITPNTIKSVNVYMTYPYLPNLNSPWESKYLLGTVNSDKTIKFFCPSGEITYYYHVVGYM